MISSSGIFWLALTVVFYAFVGYPLLLALLARLRAAVPPQASSVNHAVSIVVTARDEAGRIKRRCLELIELIRSSHLGGEIIVVSDGSRDGTADVARSVHSPDVPLTVVELTDNVGKAAALTIGCAAARHEILVFADARQTWDEQCLTRLVSGFADPAVGAVSGDLVLQQAEGITGGVGFYWRYEKWIRRMEARIHSCVGVSGSISAVRRELFTPIPAGTILDDVYWPMHVVMKGRRVIHQESAKAFDRLPERSCDEFRRKVRTLSGNFQLLARARSLLAPWRNPIWWQFVSHKLARLLAPWAMLTMLTSSAMQSSPFWRAILAGQLALYAIGIIAITMGNRLRPRKLSIVGSFCMLNAAAWVAFWVWISGRATQSWTKTTYSEPAAPSMNPV